MYLYTRMYGRDHLKPLVHTINMCVCICVCMQDPAIMNMGKIGDDVVAQQTREAEIQVYSMYSVHIYTRTRTRSR